MTTMADPSPFPSLEASNAYYEGYTVGNEMPQSWASLTTGSRAWWRNLGIWDAIYGVQPMHPSLQRAWQISVDEKKRFGGTFPTPPGPRPLVPVAPKPAAPSPAPISPTGGPMQPAPPPRTGFPTPPRVEPGRPPPIVAPPVTDLMQYQSPDGRIVMMPSNSIPPPGYVPIPQAPWSGGWQSPYPPAPPWSGGWQSPYPPSPPWQQSSGISFWGPWGNFTINQPPQPNPYNPYGPYRPY